MNCVMLLEGKWIYDDLNVLWLKFDLIFLVMVLKIKLNLFLLVVLRCGLWDIFIIRVLFVGFGMIL